jgi:hypothetical protein
MDGYMSKSFKVGNHYIPINYDKNRDSKLQVSELNIWCAENDMKYKDGEIKPAILYNKSNIPKKFNK